MKKYTIGIDLGINNVGWSVLYNEENLIKKHGVRLFKASDNASERRIYRNTRRRSKRKDTRVNDVCCLLKNIGFPTEVTIDQNLIVKRFEGINKRLEKQDITNILIYMVSHRGYIPFGDEDVEFIELDGMLPCEYYYKQYIDNGKYRASGRTVRNIDNILEIKRLLNTQSEFYKEIDDEFKNNFIRLFTRKRTFWEGPGSIKSLTKFGRFKTEEDVKEYLERKSKNSSYEKYIFEDLVGTCEISIGEKCAPKLNIHAEIHNFYNDFINISFKNIDDTINKDFFYAKEDCYKLNEKGLNAIFDYCLNNYNLTYLKILKDVLGTNKENIFGYRVNRDSKPEFCTLNNYRYIMKELQLRDLSTEWAENIESYNELIRIMTIVPGTIELFKMIEENEIINYDFNEAEKKLLKDLYSKFKKDNKLSYHALSESVLIKANIDMLKNQMNFMQVRRSFKYDEDAKNYFIKEYKNNKKENLEINPKFVDNIISSPQVKKSLRQAIRVINAIIKDEKTLPYAIAIESTKEMNSAEKQKEYRKEQKINEELRKKAKKFLEESYNDDYVTEVNIKKIMLYHETNGHCIYCNNPININSLLKGDTEIEHILPRSKSFDNSYNNITISCSSCNSYKNNKTPYYYLNAIGLYEDFKKRVIDNKNLSDEKKNILLFEGDINKYTTRFFNRNLRDTSYATKELIKQINIFNEYIEYIKKGDKILTLSTPGQLTSILRERSNLIKDRDNGKFHHAVDASIVASIVDSSIGKLMLDSQNNKNFWIRNKNGIEDKNDFLYKVNISNTINQISEINDENTLYSYQVTKNPQGQLANANIYKLFKKEDNYFKIEQINNIYTIDTKKDEKLLTELFNEKSRNKTLLCFDNNKEIFAILKEIYEKYKNDKGNPFVNYCLDVNGIDINHFDYKKHGIKASLKKKNAPVIIKLRYYSKINEPFLLNKKSINKKENTFIALDSLSQVCTRVYKDVEKNQFVFLPIYSVSVNLKTSKINENNSFYQNFYNKYIGLKKVEHIVDLYNGNYIRIEKKSNVFVEGEYQYFDKTNSKVVLKTRDNFTKSDKYFEVIDIDILGNKKNRLTCNLNK